MKHMLELRFSKELPREEIVQILRQFANDIEGGADGVKAVRTIDLGFGAEEVEEIAWFAIRA